MHEFVAKNRDKVELFLDESKLQEVIRRKKPTKYFWCDMTDMFLDDYSDGWIDLCFAAMALSPQHTHQVLTKRAERLYRYISQTQIGGPYRDVVSRVAGASETIAPYELRKQWPLPNVWLGVSAENQETADERIPWLLKTPATVRFISAEPLVGRLSLHKWLCHCEGRLDKCCYPEPKINWVIPGAESGIGARHSYLHWIRNLVAECEKAGVACFVKQLGQSPEIETWTKGDIQSGFAVLWDNRSIKFAHPKGGDPSEWPEDLRVRQMPQVNQ